MWAVLLEPLNVSFHLLNSLRLLQLSLIRLRLHLIFVTQMIVNAVYFILNRLVIVFGALFPGCGSHNRIGDEQTSACHHHDDRQDDRDDVGSVHRPALPLHQHRLGHYQPLSGNLNVSATNSWCNCSCKSPPPCHLLLLHIESVGSARRRDRGCGVVAPVRADGVRAGDEDAIERQSRAKTGNNVTVDDVIPCCDAIAGQRLRGAGICGDSYGSQRAGHDGVPRVVVATVERQIKRTSRNVAVEPTVQQTEDAARDIPAGYPRRTVPEVVLHLRRIGGAAPQTPAAQRMGSRGRRLLVETCVVAIFPAVQRANGGVDIRDIVVAQLLHKIHRACRTKETVRTGCHPIAGVPIVEFRISRRWQSVRLSSGVGIDPVPHRA